VSKGFFRGHVVQVPILHKIVHYLRGVSGPLGVSLGAQSGCLGL
jgi:hypothetical protein